MHTKILLDTRIKIWYNQNMKNEIVTKMSPEGLEIANNYLELGSIPAVCARMKIDENTVQEFLGKREIKAMAELEKAKTSNVKNQTNVQINELPFGQGNYGKLMEKLLK